MTVWQPILKFQVCSNIEHTYTTLNTSGEDQQLTQSVGIQITVNIYTEFMKMAGAPEQGILGLTEYLFTDFFHLKNQEYRSRKEKQLRHIVSLLITLPPFC